MTALIFSHQRCGSSNLTRFVAEASGVKAAMEPLNAKTLGKYMPNWREASHEELSGHFSQVLKSNQVVKHIYGQHSNDVDYLIAASLEVDRILLMNRENTHAAALSALIAKQVKNWNKRPEEMLNPISVRSIRVLAEELQVKSRNAHAVCSRTGKPFMEISYERFFSTDLQERRRTAELVLEFLLNGKGAKSPEAFTVAFDKYMNEDKKIGSDDTHRFIPNLEEIRDRFSGILG